MSAPALAGTRDHPGLFELTKNAVHGALGDPDRTGDFSDPHIGITCDT